MYQESPFKVGTFTVEPQAFRMLGNGEEIKVSKRLMNLLLVLADKQGEVVTKEVLLEEVWKEVLVSDETIRKSVSDLRLLFSQNDNVIKIQSVRGVGYRLLTPIAAVTLQESSKPNKTILWGIVSLMVLMLGLGLFFNFDLMVMPSTSTDSLKEVDVNKPFLLQLFDVNKTQSVPFLGKDSLMWHPAFSPDGNFLVYVIKGEKGYQLQYLNIRTGEERRLLTTPTRSMLNPRWSPAADSLVFVMDGSEPSVIIYDLNTNRFWPLCKGRFPYWSDDGHSILFSWQENDKSGVFSKRIGSESEPQLLHEIEAQRIESLGEEWIYSKENENGLWSYSPLNKEHTLIVEDFMYLDVTNWNIVGEDVIYWYIEREDDYRPVFKKYNLDTGKDQVLMGLPKFYPFDYAGFDMTEDQKMLVYPSRNHLKTEIIQ